MKNALQALFEYIEKDPLPDKDTSSYWKDYGQRTVVERGPDNRLYLEGVGIGNVSGKGFHKKILHQIERLSYRRISSQFESYPAVWRVTKRLAKELSIGLSFDVFKYTMVLALLVDHWHKCRLRPKTFALIGDGHGVLGGLIRKWMPEARLYCIDLPKILVFQMKTQSIADRNQKMAFVNSPGSPIADVNFFPPQNIEWIQDPIDCAINTTSMQEMKFSSIENYFQFLRRRSTRDSRFYCLNRLRNSLPGGEVTEFYNYPWESKDEFFIDGHCPFHTYFLSLRLAVNAYGNPTRRPKLCGIRIPFVNYFDGDTMHRLTHLEALK